jgi:hypothetical protein
MKAPRKGVLFLETMVADSLVQVDPNKPSVDSLKLEVKRRLTCHQDKGPQTYRPQDKRSPNDNRQRWHLDREQQKIPT